MRAHVLEMFNEPYVLKNIPLPKIQDPHDLIIKVEAASFCHTDELLRTALKSKLPTLPFVGGHEFAGIIQTIGSKVQGLKVGDRVGVLTKGLHSCGQCRECLRYGPLDDDPGYSVYCAQAGEVGLTVPGGFAEYAVVDSRQTTRIPGEMTSLDTAPFMCAGVSMYAALMRCHLPSGASVAIVGAGGGLGHLGVQFAANMGFRVVAIEAANGPLELLHKIGAGTIIVDARRTTAEEMKTRALANGAGNEDNPGVDAVIVLTESQEAFDYALKSLQRGGTCMLVSFPRNGYRLSPLDPISRGIKIVGSQVGSAKLLRDMMAFAAKHGIRSHSTVYPFEQLNQLVEDSHQSCGGKYVLKMQSSNT